MSQTKKTLYNTRLYNWSNSSDYIISLAKEFHIHGIGMKLGMPEEEHFQKVVQELQGDSVLAVFSEDVPVGVVSLSPTLFQNSHYPGKAMLTGFIVVEPGYSKAGAVLMRDAKRIAKENGADWLIVTRAVNDTDYIQKGWRL